MMILPTLIARACSCTEDTRDDPARICSACLVLARVKELIEVAYKRDGELLVCGVDPFVGDAISDLREAYENDVERQRRDRDAEKRR